VSAARVQLRKTRMTASFRTIIGVLALLLLPTLAQTRNSFAISFCLVAQDGAVNLDAIGSDLRRDIIKTYEDFKALRRGIFNENISALVESHLTVAPTFEDIDNILRAAGFDHLKKFSYQSSDAEEMYVSNMLLLKGLVENITVNTRISFRRTDRGLTLSKVDAAMIANYL
jgi:hypothetical protein